MLCNTQLHAEEKKSINTFYDKNIVIVEKYHKEMSNLISGSATYVDDLLTKEEDKDNSEINRSYGILDLGNSYSSKEGMDYRIKMKLKYHLPNIQKNLNIFLDINDENNTLSDEPSILTHDSKDQLSSGLMYEVDKGKWTRKHRVGVRFGSPLNTFVKSEIYRTKQFSTDFDLLMKQDFFYYKEEGLGTSSNLDFIYSLPEHNYLQASYKLQYLKQEQWEFFSNYSYFYNINEKSSLKYNIGAVSETNDDVDIIRYWGNIRYRHQLPQKWLFFKLTPEISFSNIHNYDAEYKILAEFQIFLGSRTGINYGVKKYRYQ